MKVNFYSGIASHRIASCRIVTCRRSEDRYIRKTSRSIRRKKKLTTWPGRSNYFRVPRRKLPSGFSLTAGASRALILFAVSTIDDNFFVSCLRESIRYRVRARSRRLGEEVSFISRFSRPASRPRHANTQSPILITSQYLQTNCARYSKYSSNIGAANQRLDNEATHLASRNVRYPFGHVDDRCVVGCFSIFAKDRRAIISRVEIFLHHVKS